MPKLLNRKELIVLSKKREITPKDLALLSEDDRMYLLLMREFAVQGRDQLLNAPEAFIRNAKTIPRNAEEKSFSAKINSLLTFDSWFSPSYVGVRGPNTFAERRLNFQAGPYEIDIRGESQSGLWHFVAEISGRDSEQLRLKVGDDVIEAGSDGWFEWSCQPPPPDLSIITADDTSIELPKISWKQPKKN